MTIQYRKVADVSDLTRVAHLEEQVWGAKPIPIHQTLTAVKNGGLMIVAEEAGDLIGFVYGFPGVFNREIYLCSHMMGVDRRYRNRGIGFGLKIKQAEMAREMGYEKIKWTYDPLESRNAHLNLGKLGAYSSDYIVDCYGGMHDTLNQGLSTDRLNITWRTAPRGVRKRLQNYENLLGHESVLLNVSIHEHGWPSVDGYSNAKLCELHREHVFIPIPSDFQNIKQANLQLALEWRTATRQAFQSAFAAGWEVVDILRHANEPIHFYVLERRTGLSGAGL